TMCHTRRPESPTLHSIFHSSSMRRRLLSIFFLYWSGPPRDLHSFPTRRSSDLANRAAATKWKEIRPARRRHDQCPSETNNRIKRSEEHTSELQSLAYLVCRLLLEKKNKTYPSHLARTLLAHQSSSRFRLGTITP